MAMKINTESEHKRADMFFVSPFDVLVCEEVRGRHKPPSHEQIVEMAESLLDHGQREPVECRKVGNNRLQLNLGFTRTAAVRMIREGFIDTQGKKRHDKDFMLKVIVSDADDKLSFIHNIVENAHRNQTSFIDDAHNQNRLRDQHGYSEKEIALLYKYKDATKVARLRRLLALPDAMQDMVHNGVLTVQAALDLLDLPQEERDSAIKSATGGDGKVNGAKVRQTVRDHLLSDSPDVITDKLTPSGDMPPRPGTPRKRGASAGPPKKIGMSMKEVRAYFTAKKTDHIDDSVKKFCTVMLKWMSGEVGNKAMDNAVEAILDAERS